MKAEDAEDGWVVYSNVGYNQPLDTVNCFSSSEIPPRIAPATKKLLNHFFPLRTRLCMYRSVDRSEHDPEGMLAAVINIFAMLYFKQKIQRFSLELHSNVRTIQDILKSSVKDKGVKKLPSCVFKDTASQQLDPERTLTLLSQPEYERQLERA